MSVADNLARVLREIGDAAIRSGRNPSDVRLVAVTKTFPATAVFEAYRAGARDFGENRVEEGKDKRNQVTAQLEEGDALRWHLIGHLQRRKAADAVAAFDMIQSVDTVRLAETLNRHAENVKKLLPVLLQVNIGADPNKFGFSAEPYDALASAIEQILTLSSLQVKGLMTIGPIVPNAEQARPYFRGLRELRDRVAKHFPEAGWDELSMGMTDDFAVAIAEGSTMVRIGRAIFGERATPPH